jgi:hypothetical protein
VGFPQRGLERGRAPHDRRRAIEAHLPVARCRRLAEVLVEIDRVLRDVLEIEVARLRLVEAGKQRARRDRGADLASGMGLDLIELLLDLRDDLRLTDLAHPLGVIRGGLIRATEHEERLVPRVMHDFAGVLASRR